MKKSSYDGLQKNVRKLKLLKIETWQNQYKDKDYVIYSLIDTNYVNIVYNHLNRDLIVNKEKFMYYNITEEHEQTEYIDLNSIAESVDFIDNIKKLVPYVKYSNFDFYDYSKYTGLSIYFPDKKFNDEYFYHRFGSSENNYISAILAHE